MQPYKKQFGMRTNYQETIKYHKYASGPNEWQSMSSMSRIKDLPDVPPATSFSHLNAPGETSSQGCSGILIPSAFLNSTHTLETHYRKRWLEQRLPALILNLSDKVFAPVLSDPPWLSLWKSKIKAREKHSVACYLNKATKSWPNQGLLAHQRNFMSVQRETEDIPKNGSREISWFS